MPRAKSMQITFRQLFIHDLRSFVSMEERGYCEPGNRTSSKTATANPGYCVSAAVTRRLRLSSFSSVAARATRLRPIIGEIGGDGW
jgi:hypothetical protein